MSKVCVGFNLLKATRAVSQFYNHTLQASGLRGTQFTLLVAINGYGPLSVNGMAEGLVMDQTTVSRNVKVLKKQGYVEMTPGADQRTRVVSITDEGKSVLTSAIPLWRTAQTHMRRKLGDKRMDVLLEGLRIAIEIAKKE
jgi:DNA-binding MarR family transcriptional regulator